MTIGAQRDALCKFLRKGSRGHSCGLTRRQSKSLYLWVRMMGINASGFHLPTSNAPLCPKLVEHFLALLPVTLLVCRYQLQMLGMLLRILSQPLSHVCGVLGLADFRSTRIWHHNSPSRLLYHSAAHQRKPQWSTCRDLHPVSLLHRERYYYMYYRKGAPTRT
jgi:hypothetical protein